MARLPPWLTPWLALSVRWPSEVVECDARRLKRWSSPSGSAPCVALMIQPASFDMRRYAKEFLTLQLQFAKRLATLLDADLGDVLAEHTVLRHLLNVSVSRDEQSDPLWQAFVSGVRTRPDAFDWTHDFYQRHPAPPEDSDRPRFGCFTFAYPFRGTPVVRLHFENLTSIPVLKQASVALRQSELKQLCARVRQRHPDAERVRGGSWLYNIDAYRRLFPPAYIATAKPVGYETGFFALWGQFLRADDTVRVGAASAFLACIERQTAVEGCLNCFPLEILRPECAVGVFYEFYGV